MIYWKLVTDFQSACKTIKYMTYWEYEYIHHGNLYELSRKHFDVPLKSIELLKGATKHYCSLRKLARVYDKTYNKKPKIEKTKLAGGWVEYWLISKDKPKKKICGYPQKGAPAGFNCINKAGAGTIHPGYGYCMRHDRLLEDPKERGKFWTSLGKLHAVSSIGVMIDRARQVEETSVDLMDTEIAYLGVARQSILQKMESEEKYATDPYLAKDLAWINEVMAKVKALRTKIEREEWMPPDKVLSFMLKVLETVTKGEEKDVVLRIAARAKAIIDSEIPGTDPSRALPEYNRDQEMSEVLNVAGQYIEQGVKWSDTPAVKGFDDVIGKTIPEGAEKRIPSYKRKDHSELRRKSLLKKKLVGTLVLKKNGNSAE